MPGHPNSRRLRLLAVFAHPDDESFVAGGTLAKYASQGWDVFLVCATYGESGQRGDYKALSVNRFAEIRRAELESASRALGIRPPMFLECADRAVAGICWNSAAKQIVKIMTRLRPDVVLTFGPDGVSGHTDHVALSQIVTSAFWVALVHKFPWGKLNRASSHSLYYALRSPAVPHSCWQTAAVPTPQLTTVIDIASFGPRKLQAVLCHKSQRHLLPKDAKTVRAIVESPEYFHRVFPRWEGTVIESSFGERSALVRESPGTEVEHATSNQ